MRLRLHLRNITNPWMKNNSGLLVLEQSKDHFCSGISNTVWQLLLFSDRKLPKYKVSWDQLQRRNTNDRTRNEINIFHLAGYIPNSFECQYLNIFEFIDIILFEHSEINWNHPIFHNGPETLTPWIKYYCLSVNWGELLLLDDIVFKDYRKKYHSWADQWNCPCKEANNTELCYCEENMISAKCSQWYIWQSRQWVRCEIVWQSCYHQ